eukprot:GILK01001865.1.p1 GENE.GILK01001865.1~~GILK01001865.1.p1  ORF type:complete len:516 (-),score=61.79 GILK01001865.1:188-1684(-)
MRTKVVAVFFIALCLFADTGAQTLASKWQFEDAFNTALLETETGELPTLSGLYKVGEFKLFEYEHDIKPSKSTNARLKQARTELFKAFNMNSINEKLFKVFQKKKFQAYMAFLPNESIKFRIVAAGRIETGQLKNIPFASASFTRKKTLPDCPTGCECQQWMTDPQHVSEISRDVQHDGFIAGLSFKQCKHDLSAKLTRIIVTGALGIRIIDIKLETIVNEAELSALSDLLVDQTPKTPASPTPQDTSTSVESRSPVTETGESETEEDTAQVPAILGQEKLTSSALQTSSGTETGAEIVEQGSIAPKPVLDAELDLLQVSDMLSRRSANWFHDIKGYMKAFGRAVIRFPWCLVFTLFMWALMLALTLIFVFSLFGTVSVLSCWTSADLDVYSCTPYMRFFYNLYRCIKDDFWGGERLYEWFQKPSFYSDASGPTNAEYERSQAARQPAPTSTWSGPTRPKQESSLERNLKIRAMEEANRKPTGRKFTKAEIERAKRGH